MRAARCLSAWKLPIGTPNCLRVFRYSSVISKQAAMPPSISAQSPMVARSSTRPSSAAPSPSATEHVVGADRHALEADERRAAAVDPPLRARR